MTGLGRFDDAALAGIAEAVREAEREAAAQIVTYIVGRCDDYPEADWAAAVLGAGLGLLAALAIAEFGRSWAADSSLILAFAVTLGAIVGWGLATLPVVRRRLVSTRVLDGRSRLRAEAAFVEEEVFTAPGRSGMLVFFALFEHRCIVLADEGVMRTVPHEALAGPVAEGVAGMRAGRPVEAVLSTVAACRRLLSTPRPVAGGAGDRPGDGPLGDLPDEPRVRNR